MFCRRSSHSVNELQFFSLLYTISSSCTQRSSFALPQAISVFTLKDILLHLKMLETPQFCNWYLSLFICFTMSSSYWESNFSDKMSKGQRSFTSSQVIWFMCLWNKHWFKIWKLDNFRGGKRSWEHPQV